MKNMKPASHLVHRIIVIALCMSMVVTAVAVTTSSPPSSFDDKDNKNNITLPKTVVEVMRQTSAHVQRGFHALQTASGGGGGDDGQSTPSSQSDQEEEDAFYGRFRRDELRYDYPDECHGGISLNRRNRTSDRVCVCPSDHEVYVSTWHWIERRVNRTFCLDLPAECPVTIVSPQKTCPAHNPETDVDGHPRCFVAPSRNARIEFRVRIKCSRRGFTPYEVNQLEKVYRVVPASDTHRPDSYLPSAAARATQDLFAPNISNTTYFSYDAISLNNFTYLDTNVSTVGFANSTAYHFQPWNMNYLSDKTFWTEFYLTPESVPRGVLTGATTLNHSIDLGAMPDEYFVGGRLYIEAVFGGAGVDSADHFLVDLSEQDTPNRWRRGSRTLPGKSSSAEAVKIAVPTVLVSLFVALVGLYYYFNHTASGRGAWGSLRNKKVVPQRRDDADCSDSDDDY
eukprot:PhM_4_TR15729/c0_g1_i1/m.88214